MLRIHLENFDKILRNKNYFKSLDKIEQLKIFLENIF